VGYLLHAEKLGDREKMIPYSKNRLVFLGIRNHIDIGDEFVG